jgi:hypothetical protein
MTRVGKQPLGWTFVACATLSSCSGTEERQPPSETVVPPPAQVVVDVTTIADKSPAQVALVLGKPTSTSSERYGEGRITTYEYKRGQVEIVFRRGKADWITIRGLENIPFSAASIRSIGLQDGTPSFANPAWVYRWENYQGLRQVQIFKAPGGGINYAYVLVNTIPN